MRIFALESNLVGSRTLKLTRLTKDVSFVVERSILVLMLLFFAHVEPIAWASRPIVEDRGSVGLFQSLRHLQSTGRVAYVILHPDDEDGGTVTMLTRGKGYEVTLLALSRGEAAGDAVGSEFGPPLGIRRTLEMMRSSEYYGVRLRVSRFLDFGLSRTLDRTLRYWNEEDALRDIVRFIRQERPHIILSHWQGNETDRYRGNHEASGLIARRAFDAAGDPKRFPEQIAEGLPTWQPLKFYDDNRTENDDWTVRVDSAVYDPVLGQTYSEIAQEGLGQQFSQAAAGPILPVAWPSVRYYKLVSSKVGMADKEADFFERIDVSLKKYPELEKYITAAREAFDVQHPEACVPHLVAALKVLRRLSAADKDDFDLAVKERQLQTALGQALGLQFEALVEPEQPTRTSGEYKAIRTRLTFVPGDSFRVTTTFSSVGKDTAMKRIRLSAPPNWRITELGTNRFLVTVSEDASFTGAFWIRDDVRDGFYRITRPDLLGEPITPDPLQAELTYSVGGVEATIRADVETSSIGPTGVQYRHTVAIAPPVSVRFRPDAIALPLRHPRQKVICSVRNFVNGPNAGSVHLALPPGWSSSPESASFGFQKQDQEEDIVFELLAPSELKDEEYVATAVAESRGKTYRHSFVPVREPGLNTVYMEVPARLTLRPVDIVVPKVRVGYVMGTGDEVPDSLRLLGIDIDLLDSTALAQDDLSQYGTIMLGVRAYLSREDVRTYNWRLLDYVRHGGVLIVQYNTGELDDGYAPYQYSLSGADAETEEDSPIEFLEPNHPVLNYPNKITLGDFSGWRGRRALRFFEKWDAKYSPILLNQDQDRKPQLGGLLIARYGTGLYVYNAYTLYRQISLGVPGAVRLTVNMIALGINKASWRTDGMVPTLFYPK